jgi:hypothetical protein
MHPALTRIGPCLLLIGVGTAPLHARAMGESLDPDHSAAQRVLPLVHALLADDVEVTLALAGENTAPAYRSETTNAQTRSLADHIIAGGPYLIETIVRAPQGLANTPGHSAPTTGAALCASPAWREFFTEPELECVAGQYGVVIAPIERARRLAPAIDAAGARYAAQFASPVQLVAVVGDNSVSGSQAEFLRQFGFLILAFPAAPAQTGKELTILAHELGHAWFNAWYDSDRDGVYGQYASTAPDWLDETAAILIEDEQGVAERRGGLAELLRDPEMRVYPLDEFLNMAHPSLSIAAARTFNPTNVPSGATVLPDGTVRVPLEPGSMPRIDPNNLPPGASRTPDGGIFIPARAGVGPDPSERSETFTVAQENLDPAITRAVLPFYVQALALADFLREESGNPRIMMEIATALRDGRSFEQWLAAEGQRHGLAASLMDLSTAWEEWLQQKRHLART